MKYLLISSYPDKSCGISAYSKRLLDKFLQKKNFSSYTVALNFQKRPISIFTSFLVLPQVIRFSPDIIHVQYTPTIVGPLFPVYLFFLHWLSKGKIVLTIHEKIELFFTNIRLLNFLIIKWEELLLFQADLILVHTKTLEEEMEARGFANKTRILDFPIYDQVGKTKRSTSKFSKKNINLTVFGRIVPKKNHIYAMKLLQKLPLNFHLNIIGSYPKRYEGYYASLTDLVHKLNLEERVTFWGFRSDGDLHQLFSNTDIFLFPYRYVTQSGALAHILGYKKPIVLSNIPEFVEFVEKFRIGIVIDGKLKESARRIINYYNNFGKEKKIYNEVIIRLSEDSYVNKQVKLFRMLLNL